MRGVEVTRPYPRSGPCFLVARGDGKLMSVHIDGQNPMEGPYGFGMTLADACRDFADELDKEVGYNHVTGEISAKAEN